MYLSCVIPMPRANPRLSLIAAVALYDAARALGEDLLFKWPNDLLKEDKKIAGILVDLDNDHAVPRAERQKNAVPRAERQKNAVPRAERQKNAVLGVGVNIKHVPKDVRDIAAALDVERTELETAYLDQLGAHLNALDDDAAWAGCLDLLRQKSATLGRVVDVDGQRGRATQIDGEGALVMETERGVVRVVAGDLVHAIGQTSDL